MKKVRGAKTFCKDWSKKKKESLEKSTARSQKKARRAQVRKKRHGRKRKKEAYGLKRMVSYTWVQFTTEKL